MERPNQTFLIQVDAPNLTTVARCVLAYPGMILLVELHSIALALIAENPRMSCYLRERKPAFGVMLQEL